MAAFFGEFEQMIDAKHRLAIPAALRDQIVSDEDGTDFILLLGPDRHLWLYPDLAYRRMLASMRRGPLPDRQSGRLGLLFAMARVVKPDKQGRIVLPEKSMERATISDSVTLAGMYEHVEVWPTDEWNKRVENELANYGEMLYEAADRMQGEMGLVGPAGPAKGS